MMSEKFNESQDTAASLRKSLSTASRRSYSRKPKLDSNIKSATTHKTKVARSVPGKKKKLLKLCLRLDNRERI